MILIPENYKFIVKRWVDVLALNIFGLAIFLVFYDIFSCESDSSRGCYGELSYFSLLTIYFFIGIFIYLVLVRIRAISWKFKPRVIFSHPPSWIILVFSPSIFLFLDFESSLYFVSFIVGFFVVGVRDYFILTFTDDETPAVSASQGDLIDWILNELPISDSAHDKFGHMVHVNRLARTVREGRGSCIAIIGRSGSGKSSVVNLLKNELGRVGNKSSDKYIFSQVNSWGFQPGHVAQTVLEASVDKVSERADCGSIVTLPLAYNLMTGKNSNSLVAFLYSLFSVKSNALDLLERLGAILGAANSHLVIILEDVDRISDPLVGEEEVPALIDRIRRVKCISFVFTISPENMAVQPLMRVIDHEEVIG